MYIRAMDATTLVAFLLEAPPGVRMVELLGSWDNFSTPCSMQRDPKRGPACWTGCHRFERIIYDGDRADWSQPRSGALKQGGRYWYYYRLNDDEEYCDPAQDKANDCPLLPGQKLNVLDVPVEIVRPPSRTHSACDADSLSTCEPTMSYDPEDRFRALYRPLSTKLPRSYASGQSSLSQSLPDILPGLHMSDFQTVRHRTEPTTRALLHQRFNADDSEVANQTLQAFGPSPEASGEERPRTRKGLAKTERNSTIDTGLGITWRGQVFPPHDIDLAFSTCATPILPDATSRPLPRRQHTLTDSSPLSPAHSVKAYTYSLGASTGPGAATMATQSPYSDIFASLSTPTFTPDPDEGSDVSTPLRLLLQSSRLETLSTVPAREPKEDAVSDVSHRLSQLRTGSGGDTRGPDTRVTHNASFASGALVPRALVAPLAAPLVLRQPESPLQLWPLHDQSDDETQETPFAGSLLEELGYLGAAII